MVASYLAAIVTSGMLVIMMIAASLLAYFDKQWACQWFHVDYPYAKATLISIKHFFVRFRYAPLIL